MCCAFKLLLPGTVNFSASYQRWLIRQWLLISAPCLCLVPSLMLTEQQYLTVGNSRSVVINSRHKEILNKHLCKNFFQENWMPVFFGFFCGDSNTEERRLNCNYRIWWNSRNYDWRKERHFPCWWWCSSVLGQTNTQKIFHKICLGPSI